LDGGVGNNNINASKLLFRLCCDLAQLADIANVGLDRNTAPLVTADLASRLFKILRRSRLGIRGGTDKPANVDCYNISTIGCHFDSDGPSDSAGSAGHDCDFVLEAACRARVESALRPNVVSAERLRIAR
jgi:hypothetical protein